MRVVLVACDPDRVVLAAGVLARAAPAVCGPVRTALAVGVFLAVRLRGAESPHARALHREVRALDDRVASVDEQAVISAVLDGDVERYEELVARHQAGAIRLAYGLLGNAEDAADAAQEAFVSAYRSLHQFQGGGRFSTWLHRIVVNKCHDLGRRRARRDVSIFVETDQPADPSQLVTDSVLGHRLTLALGELSEKQRTVFMLHHAEGQTLAEVAESMACAVGTVKSHMARATEKLRAALGAMWRGGES